MSGLIENDAQEMANIFQVLGQTARLQILFGIGKREVCVCHLETLLGERQAYISQELMTLKESGLVDSRRSGRNMYYHLKDPELLDKIRNLAVLLNRPLPEPGNDPIPGCPCPQCNPGMKECLPESSNEKSEE
jgi:DNA-binding transcriptional ArsR family regulator